MPHSCRFSYRLARTVGSLLLMVLALVPSLAALAQPIPSTPLLLAQLRSAAEAPFTVFVPIARRPRPPLGMIIQPSELLFAKAQYDARIEPARTAVRSLFKNADEAMGDTPCAVATYTTSAGYDCLNRASENAYLLAVAYRMTGNTGYSDKGAAFIHAWMDTLKSVDMSDDQANLDWSRLVPAMIWGADLLTSTPGWGEGDRAEFIAFLRKSSFFRTSPAYATWFNALSPLLQAKEAFKMFFVRELLGPKLDPALVYLHEGLTCFYIECIHRKKVMSHQGQHGGDVKMWFSKHEKKQAAAVLSFLQLLSSIVSRLQNGRRVSAKKWAAVNAQKWPRKSEQRYKWKLRA